MLCEAQLHGALRLHGSCWRLLCQSHLLPAQPCGGCGISCRAELAQTEARSERQDCIRWLGVLMRCCIEGCARAICCQLNHAEAAGLPAEEHYTSHAS